MHEVYGLRGKRVWVAGHRGMVGSALVRRLTNEGCQIVTLARDRCDLRRQEDTEAWVRDVKPDLIFLAAAKVGGILANQSHPAQFLYDNLTIATNVIHAAHLADVKKLVFLGSSCIYPRLAPQPIPEEALLTGALESTNEPYAIAKIAGIKLCQAYRAQYGRDFISAMPTNLYGPGDNFDLNSSHVLPALIRKAHEAKIAGRSDMTIWGTGTVLREFLHVDDCADALVHLAKVYSGDMHVNIGSGTDVTIAELAGMVAQIVGFGGRLVFDTSKPDGTPRKLMSNARLSGLGWTPTISLRTGIADVYEWFQSESASAPVHAAAL